MNALQGIVLILVAVAATAVVLTRAPLRQAMMTSVFGLLLAILFFAFQAPDVALSEIVIGGFVLPAIILLALAKLREASQAGSEEP